MGNGSLGNLDVNYVICIFKCGQANPSMMGSTMPNVPNVECCPHAFRAIPGETCMGVACTRKGQSAEPS